MAFWLQPEKVAPDLGIYLESRATFSGQVGEARATGDATGLTQRRSAGKRVWSQDAGAQTVVPFESEQVAPATLGHHG